MKRHAPAVAFVRKCSSALIQKKDRTDIDLATVFYFNITVSCLLYALFYFSSPFLASFWGRPILEDLSKVMALPLLINSLCLVQRTQLTIKMNFKLLAKISIVASIFQGICGIGMACLGYGVWSIAWSMVCGSVVNCMLCWLMSGWRLLWVFSVSSFKRLFSFGSKLLASTLIDTIWNNIYPLAIGKCFSAASLGFYTRAVNYTALPATTFSGVIARVSFPLLCEIQDDDVALRKEYRKLLSMSSFLMFPLMMGLVAIAKPLIIFMLTPKWEPCVPYLQILSLAMMFYPIHALNLNVLQVKGRSDLFLKVEIIKKIVGVFILLATIPLGLTAMCWGMLVHSLLSLVINSFYTDKILDLGLLKQLRFLTPNICLSLSMGIVMGIVEYSMLDSALQLVCGTFAGVLFYFSAAYFCNNSDLKVLMEKFKINIRK